MNHDGMVKMITSLGLATLKRRKRRAPAHLRRAATPGQFGELWQDVPLAQIAGNNFIKILIPPRHQK